MCTLSIWLCRHQGPFNFKNTKRIRLFFSIFLMSSQLIICWSGMRACIIDIAPYIVRYMYIVLWVFGSYNTCSLVLNISIDFSSFKKTKQWSVCCKNKYESDLHEMCVCSFTYFNRYQHIIIKFCNFIIFLVSFFIREGVCQIWQVENNVGKHGWVITFPKINTRYMYMYTWPQSII